MKKLLIALLMLVSVSAHALQDPSVNILTSNPSYPVNSPGSLWVDILNNGVNAGDNVLAGTLTVGIKFPAGYISSYTSFIAPSGWAVNMSAGPDSITITNPSAILVPGDEIRVTINFITGPTVLSTPGKILATLTTTQPEGLNTNNTSQTTLYTTAALPVTFNTFSANQDGSVLSINWSTLKESNNDHFLIELSKDGQIFKAIDSVATKAVNGNSTTEQSYSYNKSLVSAVSMLGFPAAVGIILVLMGGLVVMRNRKRNLVMSMMILIMAGGMIISCNKKDKQVIETKVEKNTKLWVRITQVDKDGKRGDQTQVIQVVNE